MGKLQSDSQTDIPPQIPPRLKKTSGAPPLPEKPLHIRVKQTFSSHQNPQRETFKPDGREILVAGPRDRPIERRQREPAKLLAPTNVNLSKSCHNDVGPKSATFQKNRHDVGHPSATYQKSRRPVLLIPRNLMDAWGPVTYAIWTQRDANVRQQTSIVRSGSGVTRSGSLTSQGSSGSDSGDENFPKSVLKKHHPKVDPPKKIVTFNAFATVQLVNE